MIVVGVPYSNPELADISEVRGGSPLGAATIAGADGGRQSSDKELALARAQGARVADLAVKLAGGIANPSRRCRRCCADSSSG